MSSPRHIIFEATRQCNLRCRYCYNHWRRTDEPVDPATFAQASRTLRTLMRTVDFSHITFTGGEPFLADGLLEHVLQCRLKGKGVSIISNGTVASVQQYHQLCELGVSLFEFPLHAADATVHDSLTGVDGSFAKVVESIRTLRARNADVCVVFVITRVNIEHLRAALLLAEQLGVRRFMLARFNIGGRGIANTEELLPPVSELRDAFATAQAFAQDHAMRISANVCVPFCIINPKDYPDIPVSSCGSDPAKRPITIDYTGAVRLCNHSPVTIGNIHTQSLDAMLSSAYVTTWQEACPPRCIGCAHWHRCRGGCRAASEQMGRSLEHEDPIVGLLSAPQQTNGYRGLTVRETAATPESLSKRARRAPGRKEYELLLSKAPDIEPADDDPV